MTNQQRANIIERHVVRFRETCGLSNTEAIKIKSLLLKLQVLTLYRPLSVNFAGMCIKDTFGRKFILVNSNDPIGRQHFTIAHELYHLFVEENPIPHICYKDVKSENEKCADCFASLLLMPYDGVIQMLSEEQMSPDSIDMATIVRLEHYFSVSRSALLNRLGDIGLISRDKREQLSKVPVIQSAYSCGYDTALYKKGNCGLVIGTLGEKAQRLFEQEKITEGHYIEILNKLNYGEED